MQSGPPDSVQKQNASTGPEDRRRRLDELAGAAARVARVETAIHDALAGSVERDPDLTVEEIIEALQVVSARQARILRARQATSADGSALLDQYDDELVAWERGDNAARSRHEKLRIKILASLAGRPA
jgi:sugar (pentulose or hexulose) kinase